VNAKAEKHLILARGYLARGDEMYRKAASEIRAAMNDDPTLTQKQVGEWFGHKQSWVSQLLKWSEGHLNTDTPYGGQTQRVQQSAAASFLRDAPMEQIERVIEKLPERRQDEIMEAAGGPVAEVLQLGATMAEAATHDLIRACVAAGVPIGVVAPEAIKTVLMCAFRMGWEVHEQFGGRRR
jgi:hypothetical protein